MTTTCSRRLLLGASLSLPLVARAGGAGAASKPLRLGIMAGPEEEIAEVARAEAARRGLAVALVTFEDYALPNEALADGDIDANAFQHKPFLDAQIAARGYKLVPLGLTYVQPMGFYSKKITSVDALRHGDRVAIQNDPSNQGRALNLLAAHGLITLTAGRGLLPSLADVTGSAKSLDLVELDAAQLPRALDDVAMASVNTNYALAAGLDPAHALLAEPRAHNPYGNLVVVRAGDADKPEMKTLLAAFESDAVAQFLARRFHGAILPAW